MSWSVAGHTESLENPRGLAVKGDPLLARVLGNSWDIFIGASA